MENAVTTPQAFNFTNESGVLQATQEVASASFNQSIPVNNVTGCVRAINAVLRLAELKLRYQIYAKKQGQDEFKRITLLE